MPYLKSIMGFMGIDDFEAVVIEGVDALPDQAETLRSAAVEKARNVAGWF